jgi:uncharacterized protein (TIGR02147 family)
MSLKPLIKTSSSIFDFTDYRTYLQAVLSEKKQKNPQFSLRAFAPILQMTPSSLSEILSGKKSISLEKALALGQALQLNVREITFLCYLIALEKCTDPLQKANLEKELTAFVVNKNRLNLDLQTFQVIAHWECIALLELLTVHNDIDCATMATTLGIAERNCEDALQQLLQSRLIAKIESGYQRTTKALIISAAHHNLALKIYHSAMLEKARRALYEQSPAQRYTGTETLMIDPSLLPEAHRLMNECLDKLVGLFAASVKKTSLVHVQINLFELNHKTNQGEKSRRGQGVL